MVEEAEEEEEVEDTDKDKDEERTSLVFWNRIRNLEDAIKSEKTLRVKMQSMLELSSQGMGARTPPGGRLPALSPLKEG